MGHNSGTNVPKMMFDNPNIDLVNMNAYIKFGESLPICSQDMEQKQKFWQIKGHNTGTNVRKMMCNNPKVDLVNIKFGENQSILV